MRSGRIDGRSAKIGKASCVAAAIDFWRESEGGGPINLAALHDWLVREHGYGGSLRSVQRFWIKRFPAPAIRARRRVETPPGAQAQVDWAHFNAMTVGGAARDLVAFKMVLSHSRREAIVWSESPAAQPSASLLLCGVRGHLRTSSRPSFGLPSVGDLRLFGSTPFLAPGPGDVVRVTRSTLATASRLP